MSDLDARMLAAHDREDTFALVDLYTEAADAANDVDSMCFFLTHAYIFALDTGHSASDALRHRLIEHKREE